MLCSQSSVITVGSEMVAVRKLLVEIKIDDIIETATNLCSTVGITPDYEDPLSNTRNDTTTPRELCESLKTTSIPLLLQELERRFSGDNIKVLKAIEALDASKSNYLDYASLTSLTEMYENCLRIDSGLLKTECQRAKILINAGKNVDPHLYPNLFKLIKVSKTLPVGTATVERSFSAMNRILSWARNTLDYSLASDFMLLSMNKDIMKSMNLDKVLDRWVNRKSRVVSFH